MFRDTKEELDRLQEQLLEEEDDLPEEDEDEEDGDFPDEEEPEDLLEGDEAIPDAPVYRNFSNDYGRGLRNFASGYRAYNGDKTDTDLDEYSEAVYSGKKRSPGCCAVVLTLLVAAAAAVAVWWYLQGGGAW